MGPWKISLPTRVQLVAREIFALQNIEAGMLSYFVLYYVLYDSLFSLFCTYQDTQRKDSYSHLVFEDKT